MPITCHFKHFVNCNSSRKKSSYFVRWQFRQIFSQCKIWDFNLSNKKKREIEEHWQSSYVEGKKNENGNKFYILSMFPYPSGKLHIGHIRVYSISDAIARFHRLKGDKVIHPMGWDSFGLPAENAAIENNVSPKLWTEKNILNMKDQMMKMGFTFDWDRELQTSDPNYYKWTQFIFLKLFEHRLAYQQYAHVNWDPVDQTVLAEEQVDSNGCSWRSGAKVEKKYLKQWFFRTTQMASTLYHGLDENNLEHWAEISKIQKHWIGEPIGCSFNFIVKGANKKSVDLSAWTPHPELFCGVTFLVMSTQHWLIQSSFYNDITKEKFFAIHPLTGEKLPIVISDEALEADCICGLPSIYESHAALAASYQLPFRNIESDGVLVQCGQFSGLTLSKARIKIPEFCQKNDLGGYWHKGSLRDWLISRQRYWGTPIPIVHCSDCGAVPVPYKELPVKLPEIVTSSSKEGTSHLADIPSWINTPCPSCGKLAKRESDTMDTFVDSSWYYLRYLDPSNNMELCGADAIVDMPVDLYIGGKEHAELHLYYARFIGYFLKRLGLMATSEPFKKLLVQGMVKGKTYIVPSTGEYLHAKQVETRGDKLFKLQTNEEVVEEWDKMSKSKYNGVDPQAVLDDLGIDTFRLMILGHVAPERDRMWSYDTLPGIVNWQKKVWEIVGNFIEARKTRSTAELPTFEEELNHLSERRNYHLSKVNNCFLNTSQLSVALTHLMSLTSDIKKCSREVASSAVYEKALGDLIIMISPYAPAFACELWSGFQNCDNKLNTSVFHWDSPVMEQNWPEIDDSYQFDMICQINGVEQYKIKVPKKIFTTLNKATALELAIADEQFSSILNHEVVSPEMVGFKLVPFYVAKINFKIPGLRKAKKKKKAKAVQLE